MVTKFRNTDIVSLASPRGILELQSAVFSICQNLYQKLVFCWHVYDRCTNCKFINWYPDVNSILNLNYYHIGVFLESTEVSASEEPNALEKAPVQFMPFRKLGGHF